MEGRGTAALPPPEEQKEEPCGAQGGTSRPPGIFGFGYAFRLRAGRRSIYNGNRH